MANHGFMGKFRGILGGLVGELGAEGNRGGGDGRIERVVDI